MKKITKKIQRLAEAVFPLLDPTWIKCYSAIAKHTPRERAKFIKETAKLGIGFEDKEDKLMRFILGGGCHLFTDQQLKELQAGSLDEKLRLIEMDNDAIREANE